MAIDRPTFSESWYRVANLKPKLHPAVSSYRQQFRGQMWHVLQDPSNNQHFRLDDAAYHFVGLLDGRRSVADAWRLANEHLGDRAPTQGEAIQMLGQLYVSNLLRGDLPPDAAGMFERYRKRQSREVRGYMTNLLFLRIPLFDPDRLLEKWVGVVGWLFSWVGLALWIALLAAGGYHLVGNVDELWNRSSGVLDPGNLFWLGVIFVALKAVHELGHGFACKRFGRLNGSGGEVHTIGIMLLVFMPIPYVDASSSWTFRSKWQRAVVGAAGMFFELAVAAVAAIVWARTNEGALAHKLAYNVLFLASVSTILFNANPLLRYDGYYILADLLEMPNLAQRSKQQLYYAVKRFIWGVKQARPAAHTPGEKFWLPLYGIASTVYRIFIFAAILLFVANKFFVIGVVLAIIAASTWLLVPLGKFLSFLFTNPELARNRPRAFAATALFLLLLIGGLGFIPAPDRGRAEGIIEPRRQAFIHVTEPGFADAYTDHGTWVEPGLAPLLRAANVELMNQLRAAEAEVEKTRHQLRKAIAEDAAEARIVRDQLAVALRKLRRLAERADELAIHAPFPGWWVAADIDRRDGDYLKPGDPVGVVARLDDMVIRVFADQQLGPRLIDELDLEHAAVDVRFKGRPEAEFDGAIEKILPAGDQQLPAASMSFAAGGSMQTDPNDQQGRRTVEPYFEVRIRPRNPSVPLLAGQRVVVRFELPSRPLALQWWREVRQLVQRRFQI